MKRDPQEFGTAARAILAMALCIGGAASLMGTRAGWEIPWAWIWVVLGLAGCAATVRWWQFDRLAMPAVLTGAFLFRLMLLPFPPLTSDDFFRYVWDGIIQHLGENPYHHVPSDPRFAGLHGLEEFRRMNSPDFHSVYPPLSQIFFYLAASVRSWGFPASFLLLKFLFMLPEAAGLWALSRRVRPRDLMLYAWNPVVVLAVVGQGHTETAMIGFLLLALHAVSRDRPGWASLALAAAGWIKLYPFLLLPFLASRFGLRRIAPGILAAATLGFLYFDGAAATGIGNSLNLYFSRFEFYSGPYYVLRSLADRAGAADPGILAARLLGVLFAAAGLTLWLAHARKRIATDHAFFAVIATYLACSRAVQTWYLAVLLALVPLIPPAWRWPWLWLAALSWGTYLLHVDRTYWPFVWLGWGGWAIGMGLILSKRDRTRTNPAPIALPRT